MTSYLQIDHVHMAFKRGTQETEVLTDIRLSIEKGEFVATIGHSGCGKSTLLNIVAGLLSPTSGVVLLDGREVTTPGPDRAVVFQNHSLLPWLTVYENVRLAVNKTAPDKTKAERHDWTMSQLELVHMADARLKRPAEISGGMKQRVGIARALAMQPKVLLLDEPFGALDAHTRLLMQEFLVSLWRKTGTTVLMVTHDVDEALFLAQRVYVLSSHPGRVKREIELPFGDERAPELRRKPEFLDLRELVQGLLLTEVVEA